MGTGGEKSWGMGGLRLGQTPGLQLQKGTGRNEAQANEGPCVADEMSQAQEGWWKA